MSTDAVVRIEPLGFPWETIDPFLFCVYHDDAYPKGDGAFGPAASLAGRQMGSDFAGKDGWRMYHGLTVPGFPSHPHRGFETVTIVRKGLTDHSDSLGAAARFGGGDVQWLTAGRGIVHAEMFPAPERRRAQPAGAVPDLAQPAGEGQDGRPALHDALVGRHPARSHDRRPTAASRSSPCIAGRIAPDVAPLAPPPDSWASRARCRRRDLDAEDGAGRAHDAAAGGRPRVAPQALLLQGRRDHDRRPPRRKPCRRRSCAPIWPSRLANGASEAELLMLQGRPIGEHVAQYGPFVMNTEQELRQAFDDYQRTRFGGWPWPDAAPVHGADPVRFARHADGRVERRDKG